MSLSLVNFVKKRLVFTDVCSSKDVLNDIYTSDVRSGSFLVDGTLKEGLYSFIYKLVVSYRNV